MYILLTYFANTSVINTTYIRYSSLIHEWNPWDNVFLIYKINLLWNQRFAMFVIMMYLLFCCARMLFSCTLFTLIAINKRGMPNIAKKPPCWLWTICWPIGIDDPLFRVYTRFWSQWNGKLLSDPCIFKLPEFKIWGHLVFNCPYVAKT